MGKNIGILHYIAGFTDGVSLEMSKWKRVLEEMGHRVFFCAGKFGTSEGTLIEELYHHRPDVRLLNYNTFRALRDYPDVNAYRAELSRLADAIEARLLAFIDEKQINFLIVQNIWSVGINPAAALALANIVRNRKLPVVAHHHDFYFERPTDILTNTAALELADCYLPPRSPLIQHVVINSLAQQKLLVRKGITATIVPNVFDFDAPPWEIDEYNSDFRAQIGLRSDDILVLQATRIVTRKGIELALDFVNALNASHRRAKLEKHGLYNGRKFTPKSRIVLVLAGYALDDRTGRYKNLLIEKAQNLGVEALFVEDIIGESRTTRNGQKVYALWDTYAHADFVTYPSLWEGWGNQLLEALCAKLPVMLFEYPVYQADIKDKGLRVISLGDTLSGHTAYNLATVPVETIERAADQALEYLINTEARRATTEHNFRIAQEHYSLHALQNQLHQLIRVE